jgi:hypothetical protein
MSTEVTTGIILVCIKLGGVVILSALIDMIKFPKLGLCPAEPASDLQLKLVDP